MSRTLASMAVALIAATAVWAGTAVALAGAPGDDPGAKTLLAGGREAESGEWPWQVAVYRYDTPGRVPEFWCGGTLVAKDWVLTAAQCTADPHRAGAALPAAALAVVPGHTEREAAGVVPIRVAQVVPHAGYFDASGATNDVALLRLEGPVDPASGAEPIRLVTNAADDAARSGARGTILGWGNTQRTGFALAPRLRSAEVDILSCELLGLSLPDALCSIGRDGTGACFGDEGGPLLVPDGDGWRQAGIIRAGTLPCGGSTSVTLFTRVATHDGWIQAGLADMRPMIEQRIEAPIVAPRHGTIEYQVLVRNTGRRSAHDVVVRNRVPDGVAYVSGSEAPTDGVIEWRIGEMPPGRTFVATYRVRDDDVAAGGATVPEARAVPDRQSALARLAAATGRDGGRLDGAAARDDRPTVIGGADARSGQFPWQVALFYQSHFICGGSLIDEQWVATAAHCVTDGTTGAVVRPEDLAIRAGMVHLDDQRAQSREVADVFVHGAWQVGLYSDIALLQLDRPVVTGPRLRPIDVADAGVTSSSEGATSGTISGWGRTTTSSARIAEILQYAELEILPADECAAIAGSGVICAGPPEGGRSGCHGDSGGPFVMDADGGAVLIGIVSAGTGMECAEPGSYTVFTGTSTYRAWIARTMATRRHDKVIVNDALEVTGSVEAVMAALSPARTFLDEDWRATPASPPPSPAPDRAHRVLLPVAHRSCARR